MQHHPQNDTGVDALPLGHKINALSAQDALQTLQSAGVVVSVRADGELSIGPRAALTPDLLALARHHKAALLALVTMPTPAPTAPPAPAKQQPWFGRGSDWRNAARTWNNHRANCPTCITADRTAATAGTGQRCGAGQALHAAYEAAFDAVR